MTRDEIIRMAREAGYPLDEAQSDIALRFHAVLADFAQVAYAAGAAAEREACKAIADQYAWSSEAKFIAAKIQERGAT